MFTLSASIASPSHNAHAHIDRGQAVQQERESRACMQSLLYCLRHSDSSVHVGSQVSCECREVRTSPSSSPALRGLTAPSYSVSYTILHSLTVTLEALQYLRGEYLAFVVSGNDPTVLEVDWGRTCAHHEYLVHLEVVPPRYREARVSLKEVTPRQ